MSILILMQIAVALIIEGEDLGKLKPLFRQAKFETGNFNSRLFNVCNNLYGMRPNSRGLYSSVEETTNGKFACYSSQFQSILDRVRWDKQMLVHWNDDEEEYFNQVVIEHHYSTNATTYLDSIAAVKTDINTDIVFGLFAAILVISFNK